MPSKPDIWMPLYIGDYLAATAHLDALESGAYLHLLMHQWKNEKLPADSDGLRRIAKVDKDAWSNAWVLLEPFFDHAKGFPVQLRLEEIREEWKGKQLKAQEKAKAAAEARWHKDAPSITQAMPQPCPSSSPSPSPLIPNQGLTPLSPVAPVQIKIRPEEFANTWNKFRGDLPKVEVFTDERRKKVIARIKSGATLARFAQAVENCRIKPHLRGDNGWTADFDWLIKNSTNIEKAINNPYGINGEVKNGKIENNLTATVGALQKLRDSRNGSRSNSPEVIGDHLFPGGAGDREIPAAIFGTTIEGKP